MRVTGVIAEYNPFHGGHQYQIARAKELSGADYCVVAMSGDFVQRGEPAVYSKYLRARAALACGADLVLEIPSLFATGSAEDFASCGVALLSGLGAVDTLCFGSECGDTAPLLRAARYLTDGSAEYEALMREGIKSGLTWPAARSRALKTLGVLDPDTIASSRAPTTFWAWNTAAPYWSKTALSHLWLSCAGETHTTIRTWKTDRLPPPPSEKSCPNPLWDLQIRLLYPIFPKTPGRYLPAPPRFLPGTFPLF